MRTCVVDNDERADRDDTIEYEERGERVGDAAACVADHGALASGNVQELLGDNARVAARYWCHRFSICFTGGEMGRGV